MFENKRVRISFVCEETTFGSYNDLTSSEGKKYIQKENFRHYLICSAPRIVFDSFERAQKKVKIKIQRDVTEFEECTISINTSAFADGVNTEINNIECTKYPEVKITLNDGHEFFFANCFEFLSFVMPSDNNILIHDVLYIGQTEAINEYVRLNNHGTFLKISDYYLKSKPYFEIFVKLLKFSDPEYEYADNQEPVDPKWRDGVAKEIGEITPDQITNLIEAILIRGCQPEYNTHYVNSFPKDTHKNYNFIFDKPIETVEVLVAENLRNYRLKLANNVGNILYLHATLKENLGVKDLHVFSGVGL
ncbi:TPA: hypothetical protein PXM79_003874 [Yersinia enterocolitica]|nr:hypothetical protein [Yersinia enterocolitica]